MNESYLLLIILHFTVANVKEIFNHRYEYLSTFHTIYFYNFLRLHSDAFGYLHNLFTHLHLNLCSVRIWIYKASHSFHLSWNNKNVIVVIIEWDVIVRLINELIHEVSLEFLKSYVYRLSKFSRMFYLKFHARETWNYETKIIEVN